MEYAFLMLTTKMKMFVNIFSTSSIIKIVLLFCIIFGGCTRPQKLSWDNSLFAIASPVWNTQAIVVIPNQGCPGCISEAESFVSKNVDRFENIIYVFTRINSRKLLKIKLGDSVINKKNIRFDVENKIVYPVKEKSIYPMIVHLKNLTVSRIDYQSPTSNGFQKLIANDQK